MNYEHGCSSYTDTFLFYYGYLSDASRLLCPLLLRKNSSCFVLPVDCPLSSLSDPFLSIKKSVFLQLKKMLLFSSALTRIVFIPSCYIPYAISHIYLYLKKTLIKESIAKPLTAVCHMILIIPFCLIDNHEYSFQELKKSLFL